MIVIDGSEGEGGGQVLRTSLALSMVTGRPFRIEKIRANRAKPGLMRQHLTAVQAAQSVSGATVEGAGIGRRELLFRPGPVTPGDYKFTVGTAGSATLVLQTVLPALMLAGGPTKLLLEGGTHNPHAPPFDFLEHCFFPVLRRMGVGIEARLYKPGFYPAGGGRFAVEIDPADPLLPIDLVERGELVERTAVAVVSNLPLAIAERELEALGKSMGLPETSLQARDESRSAGPGNVLLLIMRYANVTELVTGFGEKGITSEAVAARTVKAARRFLTSKAAVGPHLADQLLLPMALCGSGAFTTLHPSRHTLTNIEVIQRFLDVAVAVEEIDSELFRVSVGAAQ